MAILIPSLDELRHSNITEGERRVAEVFEKNLGDDCLVWFNPKIPPSNLEPDFLVLDPGRGLLILEVKDWKKETIVEATNNTTTLSVNNESKETNNPYNQAKNYAYHITKQLEKGKTLKHPDGHQRQGKLIIPYGMGVIFTKITRTELKNRELEAVFGSKSVFCKDEIFKNVDAELFQQRLWSVCPFSLNKRIDRVQINSIYQLLDLPRPHKKPNEPVTQPIENPSPEKNEIQENLASTEPPQQALEKEISPVPPIVPPTPSPEDESVSPVVSLTSTSEGEQSESPIISPISEDKPESPVILVEPSPEGESVSLSPTSKPWWKKLAPALGVAGLLLLSPVAANIIQGVIAPVPPVVPAPPASEQPKSIETESITIGILGDPDYYSELVTHLQKTLGKQVKIKLDGDRDLTYQEAKNRLAQKRWDIAFTLSPMISVAAKDNGYSWAARMFPDKPAFYQSALFVKADSPIQSLEDIKPNTVIALGDFNSASSFYMPSYDLFGKSLAVDMGHRGQDIREMVRTGKADIGAAAYGDTITNDPNFRIIHISRNIPGSGVYLSPNLSESDRKILTKVLLDVPQEVRKEANYGQSEEVDFSEFLGIVRRVEEVLACANFSQNPVNFYCAQEKGIVGQVNGLTRIDEQTTRLTMKGKDGKNYQVLVSPKTLNQIPGAGSAIALQNKTIQLLDTTPQKLADGKLKVTISQPEQMKVLGN